MGAISQKVGFSAAGAITKLAAFAKQVDITAASLRKFSTAAKLLNSVGGGVSANLKRAGAAASQTSKALSGAGNAAQAMGTKSAKAAQQGARAGHQMTLSWQTFGRIIATQLIIRALNKLLTAFTQGITQAREFGIAIAEVDTISTGAIGSQEEMSAAVLRLSNAMGETAQLVAEGLYQTLSNQVVEATDSFRFLETAMRLGVVTSSETKDAVNALSSVLNSYNLSASDAERISDVLFKTVELGRLRLEDIADILGRVTPLSSALGVSFEETAAAVAVMTRQGVKADTALTQFRAILQKLLKPTTALSKVFRSWGVNDGPTAIKTFGSMAAVLKKMSKEVAGSDAGMAKFLSRVRALAGEMGTMTNEGEDLAETVDALGNSIGAVAIAWDKFVNSPAFQQKQAINELTNEFLKLGKAIGPVVTVLARGLTTALRGLTSAFDIQRFGFKFVEQTKEIEAKFKAAMDEIIEKNKEVTTSFKDELAKRVQATREALAKINQTWNTKLDEMQSRSKELGATLLAVANQLNEDFKNSFSGLSDFVKNAKSEIKDALKASKEVGQKISDLKFEQKLDKLTPNQQFSKTMLRSAKQFSDARKLLSKAITKEQREIAREAFDRSLDTLEDAGSLVKDGKGKGNAFNQRKAAKQEIKILEALEKGLAGYAERVSKAKGKATKINNELIKQGKTRFELEKQLAKLQSDLKTAVDPKELKGLEAEEKRLRDRIAKLAPTDVQKQFLDSLGIPNAMAEVEAELQATLDKVHFDWKLEVKRLEAELRNLNTELLQKVPGGQELVDKATKFRDQPLGAAESAAAVANQFLDQGLTAAEKIETARRAGEAAELTAEANLTAAEGYLQQLKGAVERAKERQGFGRAIATGRANIDVPDTTPQVDLSVESSAAAIGEILEQLRQKKAVNAELIQTEIDLAAVSLRQKDINAGEKIALTGLVTALKGYQEQLKAVKENKGVQEDPGLNKQKEALEAAAKASGETARKQREVEQAARGAASGAGDFNQQTSASVGVTGTLVGGWNQVTSAVTASAQAAVAALELVAQAKAAAATAAFRGGNISYLAHGGQGQDTISAMLSPGEFVVNAASAKSFFSELNAINNGSQPVFREQGGEVTNVGDVNVTVNGGDSSQQTVREIGDALRRELRRGTINLGAQR